MKTAFVFYGLVKKYNDVQHRLFEDNILPFLGSDIDFFLVTSKNHTFYNERQSHLEQSIDINMNQLVKRLDFKNVILDDLDQKHVQTDLEHLSQDLVENHTHHGLKAWGDHSLHSTYNSLKQLYSLKYFYNEFQFIQDDYDYFIFCRCDLIHITPILNVAKLIDNALYVSGEGWFGPEGIEKLPREKVIFGCADRFAMMKSGNVASLFCNRLQSLIDQREFYHAECFLRMFMIKNNVAIKNIPGYFSRLLRDGKIITDKYGMHVDRGLTNKYYHEQ